MNNKNPTLNDILKVFSDKEIFHHIFEIYPEEKKSKKGYKKAIEELRTLKSKGTGMIIVIEKVKDEDEEYTSVSGKKNTTKTSYAIEYTPWNEWLGMRIDKSSLHHYNYLDVIVYCIWEMTWAGFDQKEIQDEVKMLNEKAKEIKLNIKKEKK